MSTRRHSGRRSRPATTDEGRERQLTSLAYDLAERQLKEGTAAAQVIGHFLKAGSTRDRLEQERLHRENLLLSARVDAMESAKKIEALYAEAMDAFRGYSGRSQDQDYEEYNEYDDAPY